jgi:hypothetical protein
VLEKKLGNVREHTCHLFSHRFQVFSDLFIEPTLVPNSVSIKVCSEEYFWDFMQKIRYVLVSNDILEVRKKYYLEKAKRHMNHCKDVRFHSTKAGDSPARIWRAA